MAISRRRFFALAGAATVTAAVVPKSLLVAPTEEAALSVTPIKIIEWGGTLAANADLMAVAGLTFTQFVEVVRILSGGWFTISEVGVMAYDITVPKEKISLLECWIHYSKPIGVYTNVKEMRFIEEDEDETYKAL